MPAGLNDFFSAFRMVPALVHLLDKVLGQGGGLIGAVAGTGAENAALIGEDRAEYEAPEIGHRDTGFGTMGNTVAAAATDKASAYDHVGLDRLFDLENANGAKASLHIEQSGATIVVKDFDPEEDVLVVETQANEAVNMISQTVVAAGVLVAFDNGSTTLLQGLRQKIPVASVIFVAPESGENDSLISTVGSIETRSTEPMSATLTPAWNADDPRHFGEADGFAPKDMGEAPMVDVHDRAAPPLGNGTTLTLPGPVVLAQTSTADGLLITLATGNAARLATRGTPSNPARIAAQSPELPALS